VLAVEAASLDPVLRVLGSAGDPSTGAFFLASSAGGVYAGSRPAPFDEETPPAAISPYGEAKLGLEARVRDWHHESGVPVLVGRIANLYGPGQNLGKAQGLISQVIRAHLLGRPISIYVPLDTVRDNLFVTDAARLIDHGLARLRAESSAHGTQHVLKVLASQQAVTVGFLISELGRLFKRRPHVVYGLSTASAYQARDLRLRSVVWPELDRGPMVTLPVGMARTVRALGQALGEGRLA
jgi:UDP-glucose 4-epimerase